MFEPVKIAPSILSADFMHLGRDIELIEKAGAGYVHVDVMDGHFVPNLTMGVPVVKQLKKITDMPLDVHLMISNPLEQLPWFLEAGADIVTVHAEAAAGYQLERAVEMIHAAGAKAAASVKPHTPVEVLAPVMAQLDMVLIMSVEPGFSGQSYIEGSERKVARTVELARAVGAAPLIEVDGGIGVKTAPLVAAAPMCSCAARPCAAPMIPRQPSPRSRRPPRRLVRLRWHPRRRRRPMVAKVPENYVYLDYAATAPLCEEAAQAMAPYMVPGRANIAFGGNANSLHVPGRAAFSALEDARRAIARALGATRPDEVVLTSGATEADNAAIIGLAQAAAHARRLGGAGSAQPHVVVSAIEHDAVLAPAKRLEQMGFSVTRVQPDRNGFITAAALEQVMRPETVLVSVMAANSEVGSVQPVAELARTAHAAGALFHTDATQALGKVPVNVVDWGCDAASFSAHKVGGPKGVGALYVKNRTPFDAFMLGGGQEAGRRSGTQNVCGAAGFAAAIQVAQEKQADEQARLGALRDKLYAALAEKPGVRPTVQVAPGSQDYLPNIVHVLVDALESETLILRFDMRGFGVSGGSACSSHSLEPSHVLRAIGIDADAAHGALRISMGRYTTAEDVQGFLDVIDSVLNWE